MSGDTYRWVPRGGRGAVTQYRVSAFLTGDAVGPDTVAYMTTRAMEAAGFITRVEHIDVNPAAADPDRRLAEITRTDRILRDVLAEIDAQETGAAPVNHTNAVAAIKRVADANGVIL